MRHGAVLALAASLALLAVAPPAAAQAGDQPPADQATADTTPPDGTDAEAAEPQTIAAADIAPQAEDVKAWLREITKLAEPTDSAVDIGEQLPDTVTEIRRLTRDLDAARPVSLRGVATAGLHWTALDRLLDGWRKTLQERSAELDAAQQELAARQEVWTLTRAGDLPDTVLEQIDSVLSEIEAASTAVGERIDETLTLQGDVSEQRQRTADALGTLDEIETDLRSNLFVRDQDPLWQALPRDYRDMPADLTRSWETIRSAFVEFFTRYRTRLPVHAVLFVFLVIVIRVTRGAVSAGTMSEREIERVGIVLARPFATALLVSILVLRFIYAVSPSEVVSLGRIIILVPLLRLLPRLMVRFRWLVYFLAVVYAAETLAQLAVEGSLVQRLTLFVTTSLAIVAVTVALRRTPGELIAERAWLRWLIRTMGWLGVLGLVVSLIANVLGSMALSTLLATAMFNAIWAAVVLRVALLLCAALLILTLRWPLARTLQSVRDCSEAIYRRVMGVLRLAGVVAWLVLVLRWLQLAPPIMQWGRTALEHEWAVGTLRISVIGVASFVLVIAIAMIVSKLIRFFLEQDVLNRLNLPRGAPATISTLIHYTIVGIGAMIAFAASGMDLSKLGFIVGALGVGIGFGLQNVVNNFVSGLILIFERPVKVGDLITIGSNLGNVTRIGARSSTIRTFDGADVIVPNGDLISLEVTNWTLSDQKRRTEVLVPVPIGADPRRVIEILGRVAATQEDVLDDPAPHVMFKTFDEHGMVFALRAWPTVDANRIAVSNALVADSVVALREAGIEVPRPQREVHVRRGGDEGGVAGNE
jgi:small-conductance mechanosensitive channel